jgi:hypothetical protein
MEPFAVICIDGINCGHKGLDLFASGHASPTTAEPEEEIYEGHSYTVVDTVEYKGKCYYILAERPIKIGYLSKRFIRLSEIDEAERKTEHEHEAIIYQR